MLSDTAETYGLYLALATDANIPVGKLQLRALAPRLLRFTCFAVEDFLDEDALEESEQLGHYKAIFVTQVCLEHLFL
eukprot:SAG11_NODE_102_length_16709_cov_31.066093_6_plen_77_part_00